ncbi:MAG: VIT domain-containing protein [Myxococcota bacterium]|nr:VIT domain-containing protein [Myxococcota bacterium]
METMTEDSRLAAHLSPEWRMTRDDEPMSLTASDGTGLRLHRLSARGHIQDPLALTELTLTFDNPEDRELEGRFEITLPPGAAVSRFSMKIGSQWQEGEVVEKQRARRIYEDFLHRAQDPALMEKAPGNRFSARVYPIPARSRKHIRIAWSQELSSASAPYVLPLSGLPVLENLSVAVTLESWDATPPQRFAFSEHNHRPEGDLVISLGCEESQVGLRSGSLLVARLKLDLDAPPELLTALTILVDTSASQALILPTTIQKLDALVRSLIARGAGGIPLTVCGFDQTCHLLYEGPLSSFAVEHWPEAMGASNLEAALEVSACDDRLLLISDGLPTAGATTLDALRPALAATGARRLDVLLAGGIRDADTPTGLARGVLVADGVVCDLETDCLVEKLEQATRSGITIDLPGAAWVWPSTIDGAQPGEEVLVYAELPADQPAQFEVSGARPQRSISVATVARPLLARAAAAAHIRALTAAASADPEQRAALTRQIIDRSIASRVLCDHTALLVLETAEDYTRYGLDRDTLADILTLDADGVVVLDSRQPVLTPAEKTERAPKSQARKRTTASAPAPSGQAPGLRGSMEPPEAPADDMADLDMADAMTFTACEAVPEEDDDVEVAAYSIAPPLHGPADTPRPQTAPLPAPRMSRHAPPPRPQAPARHRSASEAIPDHPAPLSGRFASIQEQLAEELWDDALAEARHWRSEDPGNVLALLALGRALEASGDAPEAARAYGSLVDLYAGRADLRRVAGERLERLVPGQALAVDTFAVAVQQRPDHPSGHRLLAWALARLTAWADAFEAICAGLTARWPESRYPGVRQVLLDDLGLLAAGWAAASPVEEDAIRARLREAGGCWPEGPSMRMVLSWETDANDVDLHIYDRSGDHACYSSRHLASGGQLLADVTTGYGPECFVINGIPAAGPYRIQAHYYRRGPMGYGTGTLQIIRHDGAGGLRIEARPFVIMVDDGWIELGEVTW